MSAASGEADSATAACFFPSMPDHAQVEDELKIIPFDLDSMSSWEACVLRQGITLHTVFLVAWSLVLREFVRTDSVRFGCSVSAKDESPIRLQSYSINIHDSMSIQDIIRHFDLLEANNAEAPHASEPYPFNSCIMMVGSNKNDSSDNVNATSHHWGKGILPTVS